MDKQRQMGFTLYELMITVMVVAVILAFGIPNLREFTLNGRMTSTANDLHAAFMMARTEAAHAKSNVTICASADQGYVVFIDTNADRARDAGEAVLRTHPPADAGVLLRIANGATYFMYAPSGRQFSGPAFRNDTARPRHDRARPPADRKRIDGNGRHLPLIAQANEIQGTISMPLPKSSNRQQGFSLIEVLIALIIMSVGMLGIAGLYVQSLQAGRTSMFRHQAVAFARTPRREFPTPILPAQTTVA
jgi:prepilin-type N-terminal cleavage/methylation domain-containing protein